jgi:hypothetical protein
VATRPRGHRLVFDRSVQQLPHVHRRRGRRL